MARMRLPITCLPIAVLALGLAALPASGQTAGRPAAGRAGADKASQDKASQDKRGGPPVIACPSLANYRMLMHGGVPAAAAQLADPKADHLGCTTLPRTEMTGLVDQATLGGQSYTCVGLRNTTACHWMAADAAGRQAPAGR